MGEKFTPSLSENSYTRRDVLRLAVGGTVALGIKKLESGVRLAPPKIEPKPFQLSPGVLEMLHRSEVDHGLTLSSPDRLYVETGFPFFVNESPINESHRAGNGIREIDKGYKEGIQLFDIDANDVGGVVYGEHGFVPTLKIGRFEFRIPCVIDINEREFKLGKPHKRIDELIKHVGNLSTPERPLGVKIELKRGTFKENALNGVLNSLETNKVPALILTRGQKEFELIGNIKILRRNESTLIGIKEPQKHLSA